MTQVILHVTNQTDRSYVSSLQKRIKASVRMSVTGLGIESQQMYEAKQWNVVKGLHVVRDGGVAMQGASSMMSDAIKDPQNTFVLIDADENGDGVIDEGEANRAAERNLAKHLEEQTGAKAFNNVEELNNYLENLSMAPDQKPTENFVSKTV